MTLETSQTASSSKLPAREHAAKVAAELAALLPEAERAGVSPLAFNAADSRRTPSSFKATPRRRATTLTASCRSVSYRSSSSD